MAEDKKKKKRIAEELHDEPRFNELYREWEQYQGKVEHPVSGKEVTKQELIEEELSDRVEELSRELKSKLSKGDSKDVGRVQKQIIDMAKKAYMAEHGIKKEPEDKKDFEIRVRNFLVNIADQATNTRHETYEEVIAEIMAADNPIYGKGDKRSKILDALLGVYATNTHKGKADDVKGLSRRRYDHLTRNLVTRYHAPHWHKKHGGILREHGYDADFARSATSAEVMGTVEDLLNEGKTNTKTKYIKVKSHVQKKPVYEYREAA